MKNIIGTKPVRHYTDAQLNTFQRWELMQIVEENAWETLVKNWEHLEIADLRNIIKTKMEEPKQEVKLN